MNKDPMEKIEKIINNLRRRKLRIVMFTCATIFFSAFTILVGYILYENEQLFYSEFIQTSTMSHTTQRECDISVFHLIMSILFSHTSFYLLFSFFVQILLATSAGVQLIAEISRSSTSTLLVAMYDEIQKLKKQIGDNNK